jgi:hypothetical protein
MYNLFHHWSLSLIGWFRVIPPQDLSSPRGGLVCIRHSFIDDHGFVIYEVFNSSGFATQSFLVVYEDCNLVLKDANDQNAYVLSAENDSMILYPMNSQHFFPIILKPLPSLTSQTAACQNDSVKSCLGMFVASYGSHGLEMLQVSKSTDSVYSKSEEEEEEVEYIHGLKVIGILM